MLIFLFLISGIGALAGLSFFQEELVLSRYILLALWIVLVFLLFRFIQRSVDTLKVLRWSMESRETANLPERNNPFGREFKLLTESMQQQLQKVKLEKEEQYHLLKRAVDQSSTAIFVYDRAGAVRIYNKAMEALFDLKHIRKLENLNQAIPNFQERLKQENNFVQELVSHNERLRIAVSQNSFTLRDTQLFIVSMQNINRELDRQELESWKKLMHVITHEIMNSVTPIKTLSWSLLHAYEAVENNPDREKMDVQAHRDTYEGLSAINSRIKGLMSFVESYRKLYKIPEPQPAYFKFSDLVRELSRLYAQSFKEKGIRFEFTGEDAELYADREQILQVLINLVKNAMDAFSGQEQPKIELSLEQVDALYRIQVIDNGPGIPQELLDEIFVPFFSTKEEGSGIGLYYSRMIAFLHKGRLVVKSKEGAGSTFILELNA